MSCGFDSLEFDPCFRVLVVSETPESRCFSVTTECFKAFFRTTDDNPQNLGKSSREEDVA